MLQSNQAGAQLGLPVAGAGDVNGDGYADVIVGAYVYDAGETDEGAAFVFLGGATGVASGDPGTAAATLQSNQVGALLGSSVAGAGDVNGDGFADVIVGASSYDAAAANEGAAFVYLGGGGTPGRRVLARQIRDDGSGLPVQPWGESYMDGSFRLAMRATDPSGRGLAKLEVEYCPAGVAFGSPGSSHYFSPSWLDVTATAQGLAFDRTITGLESGTLYHWRARVLHAPYGALKLGITPPRQPAHGPWRRLLGQAVEADLRTAAAGVAVEFPVPAGRGRLSIEGIRPNPAAGRFAVSLVLVGTDPAKLEVFDVAGRRVLARDLGTSSVERQTVVLGEGRSLPAGIYLVRLSQAGRAVSARVATLH
jgi:hypothetical protein